MNTEIAMLLQECDTLKARLSSLRPLPMEALKKIGYEDYLVMEYRAQPPENAAKAGLDYIRTLL